MRIHSHISKKRFKIEFMLTASEAAMLFGPDDPTGQYVTLNGSWNNGILFKTLENSKDDNYVSKNKIAKKDGDSYRLQVTALFIPGIPEKPFLSCTAKIEPKDGGILATMPMVVFKENKQDKAKETRANIPSLKKEIPSSNTSDITVYVKKINDFLLTNPDMFVIVEGKIAKSIKLVKRVFQEI